MAEGAKARLRDLIGEWRLYWVLALPTDGEGASRDERVRPLAVVDEAELLSSSTTKMRAAVRCGQGGCTGLALVENDRIAAVCHLSTANGPWDQSIWPLPVGSLGIADIVTNENARGRGHAVTLLREAARRHPNTPLLAHIWWNDRASLRAFQKAGARRIGFMVTLFGHTMRLRKPVFLTR